MRRRLVLVALALSSLGIGLWGSLAPAAAASLVQSAWWYRANTDPGRALPPPAPAPPDPLPTTPATVPTPAPTVADGSLLVQSTPEGATAIAALSWTLTGGETAPSLIVKPDSSSHIPADAVILACRAAVPWKAPGKSPGAWEDKPLVDCGASVQGILNPDGSVGFALGPLVSGTDLDVVITPGLAQTTPTPVGSTFSLSFPVQDGVALKTAPAAADNEFAPFASSPGSSGPADAAPSSPSSSFSGSSASSSGDVATAASPIAAPALPPEAQAPTVPALIAPGTTKPGSKGDNHRRLVAFLILLAGLAFAGLAFLTPEHADGTIGLGRFRGPVPAASVAAAVEPAAGGLGRFRRPRTGPPAALS
ncbi:MAG: hypothetical protein QOG64_1875 [Acidimicrobiaceae bacterium]|nr:hypothetical protein [Acidimicrobiaceae bacterium]